MDWLTIGLIAIAVIAVLFALLVFWVACLAIQTDEDGR